MRDFKSRIFEKISRSTSSTSDSLCQGMVAIMNKFHGYTVDDFYGTDVKEPMLASHFFGVAGLVGYLSKKMKKQMGKNKK